MTFTPTLSTEVPIVFGDRKMTMGRYANSNSSLGGVIDTRPQRRQNLAWSGDCEKDEQKTGRSTHGGVRV